MQMIKLDIKKKGIKKGKILSKPYLASFLHSKNSKLNQKKIQVKKPYLNIKTKLRAKKMIQAKPVKKYKSGKNKIL